MNVESKTMGTVNVQDDNIIKIPSGLFGFEQYTEFALITSEYQPFVWLQSTELKDLCFLVIDPFLICDDYELDIDDRELLKIGITEPSDVKVFTIVTVPSDGGAITTNLQGPLIINKKNGTCMQMVLNDSKWTTKHNILEAVKNRG